jgi:hypothetical protein
MVEFRTNGSRHGSGGRQQFRAEEGGDASADGGRVGDERGVIHSEQFDVGRGTERREHSFGMLGKAALHRKNVGRRAGGNELAAHLVLRTGNFGRRAKHEYDLVMVQGGQMRQERGDDFKGVAGGSKVG